MYKIYQFGPTAAAAQSAKLNKTAPSDDAGKYGVIYKLLWVPQNFQPAAAAGANKGLKESTSHGSSIEPQASSTKRHCFSVQGGVGFSVRPQTVLPDLSHFTYDSSGLCPRYSRMGHMQCELWRYTNSVGDKKNTYKMWVSRNNATGTVAPVQYYMLGYDSLLGSHYDRYDITYHGYKANQANEADFYFDADTHQCGSMPGPGESEGERRSHLIIQNPIHEFVVDPHRYDHVDYEFEKFRQDHDAKYETSHHERKGKHNFMHNFRFINGKNRQLQHYKLGVNRFADNNMSELKYLRGRLRSSGYNGGLDYASEHNLYNNARELDALPEYWDWSLRGAVTPVKDQAVCGSCWSFGTSGTVEGAYFVKKGKLPKLSQQQMVDCSWKFGNNGCDGGEDFRAYQYIMEAGGLASEEDYGNYLGVDGKCHDGRVKKTAVISGFYNVTVNNVDALKHALINYGPVTVAIDASRPTFTFYSHGVYYDDECNSSPDGLDHQVLVVGYVKIENQLAWLVKNSWSTYWGNNGYILMSAQNNDCGVMDMPTVPIIV